MFSQGCQWFGCVKDLFQCTWPSFFAELWRHFYLFLFIGIGSTSRFTTLSYNVFLYHNSLQLLCAITLFLSLLFVFFHWFYVLIRMYVYINIYIYMFHTHIIYICIKLAFYIVCLYLYIYIHTNILNTLSYIYIYYHAIHFMCSRRAWSTGRPWHRNGSRHRDPQLFGAAIHLQGRVEWVGGENHEEIHEK